MKDIIFKDNIIKFMKLDSKEIIYFMRFLTKYKKAESEYNKPKTHLLEKQ